MYFINGQYVAPDQASVSVLDLGLLRGFAVFDYLRTYQGRCFHLDAHLERLCYSAQQLQLALPYPIEEIREIVMTTLEKNALTEASIKVLITGGVSDDQFTPSSQTHLIVLVYPFAPYPSEHVANGITVVTTPLGRSIPKSKTTQYIAGIVALQQGKSRQAKEALYLNAKQELLEATTSNFFGFKQGVLHTCDSEEILFGITREVILELARPHFPISLVPLRYEEIPEIEEAFITSTSKEVVAVTQIDSHKISEGLVGPKTSHLMRLFAGYTAQSSWPPLSIPRHSNLQLVHA